LVPKDGLEVFSQEEAGTAGKKAAAKHRRKTYGRGIRAVLEAFD
jgi:hypothetical protein